MLVQYLESTFLFTAALNRVGALNHEHASRVLQEQCSCARGPLMGGANAVWQAASSPSLPGCQAAAQEHQTKRNGGIRDPRCHFSHLSVATPSALDSAPRKPAEFNSSDGAQTRLCNVHCILFCFCEPQSSRRVFNTLTSNCARARTHTLVVL